MIQEALVERAQRDRIGLVLRGGLLRAQPAPQQVVHDHQTRAFQEWDGELEVTLVLVLQRVDEDDVEISLREGAQDFERRLVDHVDRFGLARAAQEIHGDLGSFAIRIDGPDPSGGRKRQGHPEGRIAVCRADLEDAISLHGVDQGGKKPAGRARHDRDAVPPAERFQLE